MASKGIIALKILGYEMSCKWVLIVLSFLAAKEKMETQWLTYFPLSNGHKKTNATFSWQTNIFQHLKAENVNVVMII